MSDKDIEWIREILVRLEGKVDDNGKQISDVRVEVGELRGKAKAWGAAAGFLSGFVGFVLSLIKGG